MTPDWNERRTSLEARIFALSAMLLDHMGCAEVSMRRDGVVVRIEREISSPPEAEPPRAHLPPQ